MHTSNQTVHFIWYNAARCRLFFFFLLIIITFFTDFLTLFSSVTWYHRPCDRCMGKSRYWYAPGCSCWRRTIGRLLDPGSCKPSMPCPFLLNGGDLNIYYPLILLQTSDNSSSVTGPSEAKVMQPTRLTLQGSLIVEISILKYHASILQNSNIEGVFKWL